MKFDTIGDIVTGQTCVEIAPDAPLRDACRTLCQRHVAVLAVVEEGRIVGLLSEHDVILRAICPGRPVSELTVADVMTPSPRTVGRDTSTLEALTLMRAAKIRHLPVVEEGRPVAILSLSDIRTIDHLMVERYAGCEETAAA